MHLFRNLRPLTRALIGLFMFAQLAGVVVSPVAAHIPMQGFASEAHHQHDHHVHSSSGIPCDHGQPKSHGDDCCALHAFFAGVLPSLAVVEAAMMGGEALAARRPEGNAQLVLARLDRPPKPLP